ncbi:DNA-directed RNA polymerase III subunit RPC6 [Fukomys damarensis]|uniref:DNA-directed RNA polymerase III subunit RPC6 n=1 Tax=Fukomys damarensis TaxID=885580 RepID=A0A091DEW3_FUKDA|nr:DNA-directed RNA polymerase III subunit RPC6 [Fukomys damarensis]
MQNLFRSSPPLLRPSETVKDTCILWLERWGPVSSSRTGDRHLAPGGTPATAPDPATCPSPPQAFSFFATCVTTDAARARDYGVMAEVKVKVQPPDAIPVEIENSKMKGSDNQEKLVYQIIEDAGNKGIWSRDIRYKSNLPLTEINKILKNLESKKLIKAVKSVAASKKKVYMLYNLQPDRSVTGGAWYSDQDFESEFVEVLNQQCFKFLQSKAETARESKQNPMIQRNSSFASSHEVWKYICELGISKVELSMEDIETILNTLIYDGKVEMTIIAAKEGTVGSVDGHMKLYRAVSPIIPPTGLVRSPCGLCPWFVMAGIAELGLCTDLVHALGSGTSLLIPFYTAFLSGLCYHTHLDPQMVTVVQSIFPVYKY